MPPPRPRSPDTSLAGPCRAFPSTCRTTLRGAASPDPAERRRCLERVIETYWKPAYIHLRLKWKLDNESAKDCTQQFFTRVLQHDLLARYEPARAAFRTWLRTCLDRFVLNERESAGRLKRGGDRPIRTFDFDSADAEYVLSAAPQTDPEQAFDRAWMRSVLGLAILDLAAECRNAGSPQRFTLFEQYDLWDAAGGPRPTYSDLAARFGVPETRITNELAAARRRLRALVLERLRHTTAGPADFETEARTLLGGGA